MTSDFLSGLAIWSGFTVGILKVVDWLLNSQQKAWITDKVEIAWCWLSDQRSGKFTSLVRSQRVQIGFSFAAHAMMLYIVLAFLGRVFWGVQVNAQLQLGHPRLYAWQVWIDALALLVSAVIVSMKVHPRITRWITAKESLFAYFRRAFLAFCGCFLLMGVFVAIFIPAVHSLPFFLSGTEAPYGNLELDAVQTRQVYEDVLGGMRGVAVVHFVTAVIAAPLMAETLLNQVILFLSIYWVVFVWIMIAIFRILQFILLRIAESPNGPILGISGALIGLGAIVKALLG
jgi:hypothetical protein